ncbi:phage tail sheath subtilisin-like domain-containing protein [Pseudomonas extremaustralis]|uniref:phage tail sheath subtilisin-like domain-containing protein n=1 Tax=Pseudomonas extremaustralis TaxID=359110 RepID=UPI0023073092|nr:phage tail sheath subtilisin-like domain-containing protein [Pseudomonas extremaustralis]MDB1109711.1 phage tail sheath subtilisin-like domain-containing protein [Pseudomonas extremaustralis]
MAISSTVFNDIPAALRLPGWFVEFDNRLAGNAVFNGKLLVLGQMLASGNADVLHPVRVTRVEQADELFGRGSMLAEQLRAIKAVDLYTEVWALPLLDADQGKEAEGSIKVTTGPTETRPLALYIAGYRVWCEMVSGASPEVTARAIAEAIQADDRMPVTAAVDDQDATQVKLTCRWGGETGNSISLADSLKGEQRPTGLGVTLSEPAGGAVNPDLVPAVAALGNEWWNWICLPYTDTTSLEVIEAELASRYGPMRQKGGRAFAAFRGTHSATATLGNGRNTPHVSTMGMGAAFSAPWIWAAVDSIVCAKSLAIDPARPLQRLALPGLIGPREAQRWDDAERNMLLYDGIATYTVATDGTVQIERQITMYQRNSAGVEDDSYLDVETPETLERIRFETISTFARKYPRHKLADDADRLMYDPSQSVMTPKVAKTELLGLYKDTFMRDRAWVRDYAGYKESLQVSIDPDNPTRLNVIDSPKLIGQYRTHAQQTQFRR